MLLYLFVLGVTLITITSSEEDCDLKCSNVIDYVCGAVEFNNGNVHILKYQNICVMKKASCKLKPTAVIYPASDNLCGIKSNDYSENGRRVTDFSIVGAHQACNHTCPTYCVDTYEPACAQIWNPDMQSFRHRPMINHCHIDLFSCSTGLNVTIQPLGKCYNNPSGLLFMTQVAAMKSLKLLDDSLVMNEYNKFSNSKHQTSKSP